MVRGFAVVGGFGVLEVGRDRLGRLGMGLAFVTKEIPADLCGRSAPGGHPEVRLG